MQATTKRRAVVLVTAGALGLGGIAVASPALAGAGVFDASLAATTQQDGPPIGMGMGCRDARRPRRHPGVPAPAGGLPTAPRRVYHLGDPISPGGEVAQ